MVRVKDTIKTFGAAALVIAFLLAYSTAQAGYDNVTDTECWVTSHWADRNPNDLSKLTLSKALEFANNHGKKLYQCTDVIHLQPDTGENYINVDKPIYINQSGESERSFLIVGEGCPEGGACGYGPAATGRNEKVILQLGADFKHKENETCLITVTGAHVKLSNIEVKGVPSGMDAICLNNAYGQIDDVDIIAAGNDSSGKITNGRNGIVIGPDALGSQILPGTSVTALSEYAFVFQAKEGANLGAGSLSNSTFDPTNETLGETDPFGLLKLPTIVTDENSDISISNMPNATTGGPVRHIEVNTATIEQFFKNERSNVKIVTTGVTKGARNPRPSGDASAAATYWLVQGYVVMGGEADTNVDCNYDGTNVAERLQLYYNKTDEEGKNITVFQGFIGEWTRDSSAGLDRTATLSGAVQKGYFSFYLPEENQPTQIVLVPESAGHQVGQPKYIPLVAGTADCASGVGGKTNPSQTASTDKFYSREQCNAYMNKGYGAAAKPRYDMNSDGDALLDDEEDVNRDCDPTNDATSWLDPDSDHDGIPDGVGKENVFKDGRGDTYIYDSSINNFRPYRRDDRDVINANTVDPDKDGIPSAADPDSDNDGIGDGAEDRSSYYDDSQSQQNTEGLSETTADYSGYYHLFLTGFSGTPPNLNGAPARCTMKDPTTASIGTYYDWYLVTYAPNGTDFAAEPTVQHGVNFDPNDPTKVVGLQANQAIVILECRHWTLSSALNFNGNFDQGNLETDFVGADSDGDLYCDGPGDGSANDGCVQGGYITSPDHDLCPTVKDTTNACKRLDCNQAALSYGINPDLVTADGSGLKKEDGYILAYYKTTGSGPDIKLERDTNGMPIWRTIEDIRKNCFGDLDKDGIPNCVESPSMTCGIDNDTHLSPAMIDTDDDGLVDGWRLDKWKGGKGIADVCPAGPGSTTEADKFEEGNKAYSCGDNNERWTVYQSWPILSCFLDRDGDGLRDCEEDLNMNGVYDPVPGLDGITKSDSSPLALDTDKDTWTDFQERKGTIKTNPGYADTDEDGLPDGVLCTAESCPPAEDYDHDKVWKSAVERNGSEGCPDIGKYDTDPTKFDTDGDGIKDGTELTGTLIVGQTFILDLSDPGFFSSPKADLISDPTLKDSDGDRISDDKEYGTNGIVTPFSSNPCMRDSDGDNRPDIEELDGCKLNPDPTCKGGSKTGGLDSDGDGVDNDCEIKLKTNPDEKDSDHDFSYDNEEDSNGNCETDATETDPNDPDSDKDGLQDGIEVKIAKTKPLLADSDGDCIPDGPSEVITPDGEKVDSKGEIHNTDGVYRAGVDTDPNVTDTDGDGLPDGWLKGMGEDRNCSGMRDKDASGGWLETDPRMPDSDLDGDSDFDEMWDGGSFDLNNLGNATTGHGEGCFMNVAGGASAPTSMMYLFGLVLVINRMVSRCLRKR